MAGIAEWTMCVLCTLAACPWQHPHGGDTHGMQMPGSAMSHGPMDAAGMFLMQQASGTATNPAASREPMFHMKRGAWNLMLHGLGFFNSVQQTGPRGADKIYSTNWLMGMAERQAGKGTVMFRTMLSLEPATITGRRYPELFQTGETAYGKAIVDAQHPHNLFMELAVEYARPLAGGRTILNVYAAPVGDPALGPVAYPHRVSAREMAQGTLSHHLQDSTHISYDVITAGVKRGMFRLEASGFHGAEPGENRWTIGYGAIDSWAARLWITPSPNWAGQVSAGRLTKPEALESGDIVRSTASLTYDRPIPSGDWATSVIWGRNHKTAGPLNTNSYLLESVLCFRNRNYITARIELVDKDELFATQAERERAPVFRIQAYTAGYTRDVFTFRGITTGIGGNVTLYGFPRALDPYYGTRPVAAVLFARIRPEPDR